MRDFEDVIERYYRELVEFAAQNMPAQTEPAEQADTAEMPEEPEEQPETAEDVTEEYKDDGNEDQNGTYASYDNFLAENTTRSLLKIRVFSSDKSNPIGNAAVKVCVKLSTGEKELYSGYSDGDGMVEDISLPAPDNESSLQNGGSAAPYAAYDITVTHPDYARVLCSGVPVFDSVTSVQPVMMAPLITDTGEDGGEESSD
ncbi:MAG: hypothetical protein IJT03_03765 [Clostridia bacterium]|nr:hypothetical protein [Clostridia bacterium]